MATQTPPREAQWIKGTIPGIDTADLETDLMQLRSLSFKRIVPADTPPREKVRQFLVKEQNRNDTTARDSVVLRALGFVPAAFPLKQFSTDLLTSQLAGYYDPRTKRFNVVAVSTAHLLVFGAIASLFGYNPDRLVTIHEMDHALDDQYFDILAKERIVEKQHNQDAVLALRALMEGEATWIMMADEVAAFHRSLASMTQADMDAIVDSGMSNASLDDVGGRKVPLIFQRSLLFPYLAGARFVHHLRTLGPGWGAVNRAWTDLPESTQQILHPELYSGTRRTPDVVHFARPFVPVGDWKPVDEDTLGEFLFTVWFEQHTGDPHRELASHWRTDRYRVYRQGDRNSTCWVTEWDGGPAAEEFKRTVRRIWPADLVVE
ncbi:MAG TPA: hypothetical protein VGO93_15780, partial [Candidatus Xenobia bacterium]